VIGRLEALIPYNEIENDALNGVIGVTYICDKYRFTGGDRIGIQPTSTRYRVLDNYDIQCLTFGRTSASIISGCSTSIPSLWLISPTLHMDGNAALWLKAYRLRHEITSWPVLMAAVEEKFGADNHRKFMKQLLSLKQRGTWKSTKHSLRSCHIKWQFRTRTMTSRSRVAIHQRTQECAPGGS
jgi:hypothetical protein